MESGTHCAGECCRRKTNNLKELSISNYVRNYSNCGDYFFLLIVLYVYTLSYTFSLHETVHIANFFLCCPKALFANLSLALNNSPLYKTSIYKAKSWTGLCEREESRGLFEGGVRLVTGASRISRRSAFERCLLLASAVWIDCPFAGL